MERTRTLDEAAALAAVRRTRVEREAAEVRHFREVLAWCQLHVVKDLDEAATWGDSPVLLAGEGAPQVSEFCVYDIAAALGLSADAARTLVGEVIEIGYRLPGIWSRVQAGSLPAWRARRVAAKTKPLTPDAALFVDAQVAGHAPRIGNTALDRLVDEAIARFMPETAVELAEQSAERRFLQIDHQQVSFMGSSAVRGELDLLDALDLEKAVAAGAERLKALGSTDSLDVRRSQALGHLARGDRLLPAPLDVERVATQLRPARDLTVYVHLPHDALTQGGTARVENPHLLVTAEQVAAWCGAPESRVTIKPVIDLNQPLSSSSYEAPERIREHVILRDRTCVHPYCTRNARFADLDHIIEWVLGGRTNTGNLAPLCRSHHRLKTFSAWTYTMIEPGCYLWRSPFGEVYLRDQTGTRDLTPRPVEPPGS